MILHNHKDYHKYFNKFKSTEKIYITEMDLNMNLKGSYKNLFNMFIGLLYTKYSQIDYVHRWIVVFSLKSS